LKDESEFTLLRKGRNETITGSYYDHVQIPRWETTSERGGSVSTAGLSPLHYGGGTVQVRSRVFPILLHRFCTFPSTLTSF
jgi:hypothetical protein